MLAGAALLVSAATPALAQYAVPQAAPGSHPSYYPSAPCPAPEMRPPTVTTPETTQAPTAPESPTSAAAAAPEFGAGTSAPVGGNFFAYGEYIDSAIIRSQFRFRYDAAYDNNRPDRAEFFYAKCGCFPGSPGPPLAETSVDYQDFTAYLEWAFGSRFSAFVETPWRLLNPEVNANTGGYADMNAGFKLGLVSEPEQLVTFQFRTFIPTGDADRGLGTNHVSLEPALLLWRRVTDRLVLEGELRDWIPVGGTDFAGNVLRYGVGASYNVAPCPDKLLIAPVAEVVGWTVLGGRELANPPNVILDAAGDTIVNMKLSLRLGYGDHTFSVGYGRALTGDVWYKDIVRVEYRLAF
jgi:hypothetical protein